MADLLPPILTFDGACPDCGERSAVLPLPIPGVEDDFDWQTRDYDGFRLMMMQDLASRFPERRRWTPADPEVAIVEVLAAALDRASHALDRVQAERFLDSARRPGSVRRLLALIGWQADQGLMARLRAAKPGTPDSSLLEEHWAKNPAEMEAARRAGPRRITEQRRMVTLGDHGIQLEAHPLVRLAQARLVQASPWTTVMVSVLLADDIDLDAALHAGAAAAVPSGLRAGLWDSVVVWHDTEGLPLPPVTAALTGRAILRPLIEARRLIGTEVILAQARAASVAITLSIRAKPGYFRSELRQALAEVFSSDEGGFFAPGRLRFGEALYASDIIEAAMAVEGVAVACLNQLRRVGSDFPDLTAEGVIPVAPDEYIRCMSDRRLPEEGWIRIVINEGEAG